MSKKIISIIIALAAACGGALAQYKQSGAMLPMNKHNTVLARKAIDTADLRILYAWGATDITQDSTYLDCGQLQIGKRMTKYCSLFVEQADDERVKWAKANPHPAPSPQAHPQPLPKEGSPLQLARCSIGLPSLGRGWGWACGGQEGPGRSVRLIHVVVQVPPYFSTFSRNSPMRSSQV